MRNPPKLFSLLVPFLAATFCLAQPATSPDRSVFDTLQDNVWYLPTQDGAARLYVTAFGHGSPVIVLHGGPGNDFNYLVDALRPQTGKHRFTFYDQRGSLLSPVAPNAQNTLTAKNMVDDLDLLRRTMHIDKVTIFAHSWGTLLALMYYQAHPDHVANLVLVASFPPRTPPGSGFAGLVKSMRPRQKALTDRPVVETAEKLAGVSGPERSLTPQQSSTRKRIELAASNIYHIERWHRFQGEGVYYNEEVDSAIGDSLPDSFDVSSTFVAHPVPVTVIKGVEDYLDPGGISWNYLLQTSPITIDKIPEASHYPWIDDPALFQRDIERALNR
jgi:proline iminopeptidase